MDMTTVTAECRLPLPAVDVWERIGGFADIAAWHPGVMETRLEDGYRLRRNRLAVGDEVVERLLDRDNAVRRYAYEVLEGPLPAASVGILGVDAGPNDDSIVRWTMEFEANGKTGPDAAALEAGIHRFLQQGLDALVRYVGEGIEST
jgi:hypothetical protein